MTVFHGTIKKNYKSIMREGFKPYSQFTPYFNTAVQMGGPYVIAVDFPWITKKMLYEGGWEFMNKEVIPPKLFEYAIKVDIKVLMYNSMLIQEERKQEIDADPDREWCETCKTYGELTYLEDGHCLRPTGSSFSHNKFKSRSTKHIVPCPVCSLKHNPNYQEVLDAIKATKRLNKGFDPNNPKDIEIYKKFYLKNWKPRRLG
jgi:hypothetical protein